MIPQRRQLAFDDLSAHRRGLLDQRFELRDLRPHLGDVLRDGQCSIRARIFICSASGRSSISSGVRLRARR